MTASQDLDDGVVPSTDMVTVAHVEHRILCKGMDGGTHTILKLETPCMCCLVHSAISIPLTMLQAMNRPAPVNMRMAKAAAR
jgi:hypothetical protein